MRKQIFINYITNHPGNSSNFSDLEYMPMKHKRLNNSSGFTLVELMVTVFLTAIAVIAIYRGYTSFSQSADAQQQVIEMQQNLRIGMHALVKDIIRAGMKEEDDDLVAFTNAASDSVGFEMDLTSGTNGVGGFASDTIDNDNDGVNNEDDEARIGDGDVLDQGEQIEYQFVADEDVNNNYELDTGEDANGNGVLDSGRLQRRIWTVDPGPPASAGWGNWQTIITNVSALDFVYLDEDGTPTAVLEDIDTVEISMVVRTTNQDYRIINTETYQNRQGDDIYTAPGDNFRRRVMSMRVKVRNAQL